MTNSSHKETGRGRGGRNDRGGGSSRSRGRGGRSGRTISSASLISDTVNSDHAESDYRGGHQVEHTRGRGRAPSRSYGGRTGSGRVSGRNERASRNPGGRNRCVHGTYRNHKNYGNSRGNDAQNQGQATNSTESANNSKDKGRQRGHHMVGNVKIHDNGAADSSSTPEHAGKKNRRSRTKKIQYETHLSYSSCLKRYNNVAENTAEPALIRGKIRVMPAKNGASFLSCDRGSVSKDILIVDEWARNRALDGDYVFVELLLVDACEDGDEECEPGELQSDRKDVTLGEFMESLQLDNGDIEVDEKSGELSHGEVQDEYFEDIDYVAEECADDGEYITNVDYEEDEYVINDDHIEEDDYVIDGELLSFQQKSTQNHSASNVGSDMWQDDEVQMRLWDPVVNLRRKPRQPVCDVAQRRGKVVCVIPPKTIVKSELTPADESHRDKTPSRTIVGTLAKLPDGGNKYLLLPNNKALPRFMCAPRTANELELNDNSEGSNVRALYKAEYIYGSWSETNKWPPCIGVTRLCGACTVEDETKALLVEYDVDHGDFSSAVLRDVDTAVKSGSFLNQASGNHPDCDMGWKPTEEMFRGRRDYRNHRVFTIDPTTARDLDDALHISQLSDGRVEIGVHIADVSHFIKPETAVDDEALRRATTVYLVDRVIPMLPRPLCEIACSLNENVERLAFSCVWKMNMDGTMSDKKGKKHQSDEVWYGRTVIKSCSRLDYATAQNIIDKKVATGETEVDASLWPKSRQPTGRHTIDEVAGDVRLMHKVAMARRKLRFENGALALNGIKLTFQMEEDGETPKMAAPYPIRDSNRLIEEYMLLANFLVAQRLITHAKGRALLRQHPPPLEAGLQNVVEISKESFNFDIDITSSQTLQESLSHLSRTCNDELVIQCVTESLMTPMRPAEYIAAGEVNEEDWKHFALNIPYYTHFTSPIRRYPDVLVHRLLQATLDDSVADCEAPHEIHSKASHCNDKRMASKKAQERSDRIFLSFFLKKNPISSALAVCLGIGEKTFTVFVPSLGFSTTVFLQEHEDIFEMNTFDDGGRRKLMIRPKTPRVPGLQEEKKDGHVPSWTVLNVGVFSKLEVACYCKDRTPIDVKVMVVGPWTD